jgi:hypothetical protein
MKHTSLFIALVLSLATGIHGAVINLHSGNGSGTDSLIKFLDGPNATDFAALTPANFTSAQSGPAAFIMPPNGAWLASLPADSGAKWIGTNASAGTVSGDTALYAMSFTLANPVASASITLNYATDNQFGSSTNNGLFLNGTAVTPAPTQGSFTSQLTYTNANIGSLLTTGTNWIYFDAVNVGGPAGFIFSATITTQDVVTAAPEPTSLLLIGGSLIAIAIIVRYGRSRA